MATMKDIANAANVSTATVSRVLNNSGTVSEKRRAQVEKTIQLMNYSPNALARELVTKSTSIIGILIPDIENIYYPTTISILTSELESMGYNIILGITGGDYKKEMSYIDTMMKKRAEGIILLGSRLLGARSNAAIEKIHKQIPVIVMDYAPSYEYYSVRVDEVSGAYKATEYLIELGHKRIAFINGEGDYSTYFYKRAGFEKAMMDYGIEIESQYCVNIDPHFSGGQLAAEMLMNLEERPTAIFTAGDQIAIGAYHAIQSLGLKIPDDVSIVGFSGTPISAHIYPPLTTIDQFPEETGRCTARLMVSIINNEKVPNRQIIFEPKLIIRGSCRPINK